MMAPSEKVSVRKLQDMIREDNLTASEYARNMAQKNRRAERIARRLSDKRGGRR